MEWQLILILCLIGILLLFATGLPIAICFMIFNFVGAFIFFGSENGIQQIILSFYDSVSKFSLLPIPLFVLMGELIFQSGIAFKALDVLDKFMGRIPGRLSLISVAGGALFATVSSSTAATAVLLGKVLLPEMQRRGYKKPMTIGPIMGSGVLAPIIPPSGQAVLLASLAGLSAGKILIAAAIPGIVLACIYAAYIIIRCLIQPSLAPVYEISSTPMREKLLGFVRYVLPLGAIFFMAVGIIFIGITSATEAAATGVLGTIIIIAIYRKLSWGLLKKSAQGAARLTVMLFMILLGANAFSQILAFSGSAAGLTLYMSGLHMSPIFLWMIMLFVVLILGCFMDVNSIMMITLPIYMPVVNTLGINPLLFGVTMLICLEVGCITPPFGVILFAMSGVVPKDITLGDIYRAGVPFIICDLVGVAVIMAFPILALWLPSIMIQ